MSDASRRNYMKMRLKGVVATLKQPSSLFPYEKSELDKALVHIETVLRDWELSNKVQGIGTRASHRMSKKKKQAISNLIQSLCLKK
mgnify:CR=1 FL=1